MKYDATWHRENRRRLRLKAEAGDPEAIAKIDREREKTRDRMRKYHERKRAGLVTARPRQSEVMSVLWTDPDFRKKTKKRRNRRSS